MAKQLNVSLAFSADTSKAKQQIAELDKMLSGLSVHASKNNSLGLDKELTKSLEKAAELKAILNSSLDSKGGLDLSKFNSALKKSKTDLKDYASSLIHLGPQGEQAFIQLARSISAAEVPLKRGNAMLREFATTLKNTARWQISSSILHGFMGTLQSAYGYAEDLNESLNNIRIVTGQSTEQMAKFAKEANRAAKELNTTTTSYTDAALIYYQQGLSDKQVKERTEVTVKMANVARESATEVSSYMTAIWNNFDKEGTQSLEHFGDVITALGAATAASTEEIAHGLEKFAAVADTIGLSYDYATSAIATIVDKTRQSEDVVGTALKTIFARIQGLKLGETLDDGTSLNKYSEALASVGISIFDSVGELKNMDTILDEMGAKWQLLSKDQQVALAQTVAGVRQYNQLVSLMDNYDAFKGNVEIARNSDGALQEQADIYAESWEAARDRVQAAAEGLYDSLLNDDFFITLLNGFEKLLTTLENVIDGFGGMGGAIALAGSLLFKHFGPDIAESIDNGIYNITHRGKKGFEEILESRKKANEALKQTFIESADEEAVEDPNSLLNVKATVYTEEANLQDALLLKKEEMLQQGKEMNEIEEKKLQILLDETRALGEQAIKKAEIAKALKEDMESSTAELKGRYSRAFANLGGDDKVNVDGSSTLGEKLNDAIAKETKFAKATQALNKYGSLKENAENLELLQSKLKEVDSESAQWITTCEKFTSVEDAIKALSQKMEDLGADSSTAFDKIRDGTGDLQGFDEKLNALQQKVFNTAMAEESAAEATHDYNEEVKAVSESIANVTPRAYTLGESFGAVGNSILTLASAVTTLTSLGSLWEDEDISTGQKLLTTVTTLGMVVPMLTKAFSANNLVMMSTVSNSIATALGFKAVDVAALTSTGTVTAFGTALWSVLWPIGLVMAAIGGLVAIFMVLQDAYNKDANNLNEANENLSNLTEEYNKATEAAKEFKEAISGYEEGVKNLEDLDAGTEEYNKTLEETNEQAKALIEKYKLFGQYEKKNGLITFKDGALENIESELTRRENMAEMMRYGAQMHQNQMSLNNDATQVARNTVGHYYVQTPEGAMAVQATGAQVKQLSAVIQEITDEMGGVPLSTEELITAINNSEDAYGLSSSIVENLGTFLNKDTRTALYGYCDSVQQAAEANRYYAEQILGLTRENTYGNTLRDMATDKETGIVDEGLYSLLNDATGALLSKNDLYNQEEYTLKQNQLLSDVLSSVSTYDAGDVTEDNIVKHLEGMGYDEQWLKDNYSNIFAGSTQSYDGNINAQEMARAYYESLGYTITSTQDKNGFTKFSGTDANGDEWDTEIDNENAQSQWAQQIATYALKQKLAEMDSAELSEEQLNKILQPIVDAGEIAGVDFTNAILGSVTSGSLNFESLFSQISGAEKDQLTDMSADELATTLGLTPENLELLGYDSAEAFKTAFDKAMGEWEPEDYTETANAEGEATAEALDLDVEEFKAYRELLDQTTNGYYDNVEGLNAVAIANKRMERGVKALADDWEDFNKIMSDSDASMEDISSILPEVNGALQDILNLDTEDFSMLPPDFAKKHWDLINDVTNGVEGAVEELRDVAGQEILLSVDGVVDPDGNINQGIMDIHNAINSFDSSQFKVGVAIKKEDEAAFYQTCQSLINAAGMSAEQAQAYFGSMGYNVEFDDNPQKVQEQVTEYKYTYDYDENGEPTYRHVEPITKTVEMEIDAPTIKTITPTGSYGGGVGVNSSAPKSATAPKTDKSGGGNKDKKKKDNKTADKEVDRYHEIKEELSEIERVLNKVSKAKSRTFGAGKIANINKETNAIRKQISALEEYQRQVAANMQADRALAQSYGWIFDANGYVTNYEATLQGLMNAYNAAVAAYNAAAAGSEEEKAAQEQVEIAEKEYQKAKDALARYEETRELYESLQDQIRDAKYAEEDAILEGLEYKIELKLDVNDRELALLEDMMETIGDSADRAVDKLELIEKSFETIFKDIQDNKDALREILDYAGVSGSDIDKFLNGGDVSKIAEILSQADTYKNMEQVVEDLKQYVDNLMALNEQLRNYREQIFDTLSSSMTEYINEMDRAIGKLEHLTKLTQGYQNIINAVGKANIDADGSLTKKINETLEAQAKDAYRTAVAKQEYAQRAYDEAVQGYQAALETGDEFAIQKWEEILRQAEDDLWAAQEESQAAMQAWAEAIGNSFKSEIAQVIDDLDKALGGLRQLRDKFNQNVQLKQQYIEDYEKIYELSKLTRQTQSAIDETDNLQAKKRLMEYQQKINAYQENGVRMSQYEVQYLQQQLDLELAKIALEEAKNAKSQVTMTRDNDGNYSYVYTADENEVANAQQTYEDKLFQMQQLNGQYINELQENLLTMQEEMSQRLQEIANDDALSYEEKQIKMQEVTDYYLERIHFYSDQLEIVLGNNAVLYNEDWKEYSEHTGYKISANEDYVDSWEETTLAMVSEIETQEEYLLRLEEAICSARDSAVEACDDAIDALEEAGLITEKFGQIVQEELERIREESEETADEAEEMSEEFQDAISEIMDKVEEWTRNYAVKISEMIAQNQKIIASMNEVIRKAAEMANALNSSGGSGGGGGGGNGPGGGGGGGGNGDGVLSIGDTATLSGSYYHDSYGTSPSGSKYSGVANGVVVDMINNNPYGVHIHSADGVYGDLGWVKKSQLSGYDTGGYTGDWAGKEGKLALLHQKELILNAEDTSNMLKIIDMVRDISNIIDINALSSMSASGLTATNIKTNNNGVLEQQVSIVAEFHDATTAHEITAAFDNLINQASQYANHK